MRSSKLAASGMIKSATGKDTAPESYRRFAVEVTLASERDGLGGYPPGWSRVADEGMEKTGPIYHGLESVTVPMGRTVSGGLVYRLPEEAVGLRLTIDGGRSVTAGPSPTQEGGQCATAGRRATATGAAPVRRATTNKNSATPAVENRRTPKEEAPRPQEAPPPDPRIRSPTRPSAIGFFGECGRKERRQC